MSIAELVPSWKSLPDPVGPLVDGDSLRGRAYRMRSDGAVRLDAHGILLARGQAEIHEEFLSPRLDRDMPSPWLLKDMDVAAERIALAVERRERVLVFGDYDVDGASSTAVMGRWFAGMGLEIDTYIPDRISEGYGPTPKAMESAMSCRPDLVICVDCGTASAEVLEGLDADVIVIDHHKQQGDLPNVVAVVNPHRLDDTSALGMLCATALAFLVVVATSSVMRERGTLPKDAPRSKDLLDLVALATVADVVPLVGPSRLFVAKGLEVMARTPSPGVAALMQVAAVKEIGSRAIGFALGPRVNAGGRVGVGSASADGAMGAKLLLTRDHAEAAELAGRLDAMNRERQSVEKECLDEAMALADAQIAEGAPMVSVFGKGWHPGVVGIVAGRIREKFDVPALVGAWDGKLIKGSGRSVPGFDLGSVIIEARKRGLLETGGGHAMACGFGCSEVGWADFQKFVRGRARWTREASVVDCHVEGAQVALESIASLSMLEPLGMGNPNVVAIVSGLTVDSVTQMKGGHVKMWLKHAKGAIEGLWWRAEEQGMADLLGGMRGVDVRAIGKPKIDEWNGRRKIVMELEDIIPEAS